MAPSASDTARLHMLGVNGPLGQFAAPGPNPVAGADGQTPPDETPDHPSDGVGLTETVTGPAPVLEIPSSGKALPFPESAAIVAENALPGTTDWFVARPDQGTVAGFFDHQSYLPGGVAKLSVASNGEHIDVDVYRMGYYGGAGGRLVYSQHDVANHAQPAQATVDARDGGANMVHTGWTPSTDVPIGSDWVSGLYVAKLTNRATGGQSYAVMTVRSATPAPVVLTFATNTWQAYNEWGGASLYRGGGHKVSFDRPYNTEGGAGQFFMYDQPLVQYLEANGYPVSYATDADAAAGRSTGARTKLVMLTGHPEYHVRAEVDYYTAIRQRGVNLAMMGGNFFCWQARYEQNGNVMTVWRDQRLDPLGSTRNAAIRWESTGYQHNALWGAAQVWAPRPAGAMRVENPSSWAWRGAGVAAGTPISGVLGHEYDGISTSSGEPVDTNVLARARASASDPGGAAVEMTLRTPAHGGFVFSANQLGINWALAHVGVTPPAWVSPLYPKQSKVDPAIRHMVGNVITHALGVPNPEPARAARRSTRAPLTIVSPTNTTDVPTRPGKLMVQFTDPRRGARLVRVRVDGVARATLPIGDDTWIGTGPTRPGLHRVTLEAVNAQGTIMQRSAHTFRAFDANSTHFRPAYYNDKPGGSIFKSYGDDVAMDTSSS